VSPSPLTLWLADVARATEALEVEVVQRLDEVRRHGGLQGVDAAAFAQLDMGVFQVRAALGHLHDALATRVPGPDPTPSPSALA
jgi:hypothetical protein